MTDILNEDQLEEIEARATATTPKIIGRRYGKATRAETAEMIKKWFADNVDVALTDPLTVDDFFVLEDEEGRIVAVCGNGPTSEKNGLLFMAARADSSALIASHRALAAKCAVPPPVLAWANSVKALSVIWQAEEGYARAVDFILGLAEGQTPLTEDVKQRDNRLAEALHLLDDLTRAAQNRDNAAGDPSNYVVVCARLRETAAAAWAFLRGTPIATE